MADKSDLEERPTQEVLGALQDAGATVPELGLAGGEPTDTVQEQETDDRDTGDDAPAEDAPVDATELFDSGASDEVDPMDKDPMQVEGATEERLAAGRRWLDRMVQADQQIIQNQWNDDPNIEIVVPTDIFPETGALIQDARVSPGNQAVYGLGDASFISNVDDIHRSAVTSFQFVIEEPGDIESGPYDIRGIIDALQADDEPFVVTYGGGVDTDIIPV